MLEPDAFADALNHNNRISSVTSSKERQTLSPARLLASTWNIGLDAAKRGPAQGGVCSVANPSSTSNGDPHIICGYWSTMYFLILLQLQKPSRNSCFQMWRRTSNSEGRAQFFTAHYHYNGTFSRWAAATAVAAEQT